MAGRSPEQLEAEVAARREELARTVDQLGARLDVRTRASRKVAGLRDRVTTADGAPRPGALAAGALLAMAAVTVVWRLRQGGNR